VTYRQRFEDAPLAPVYAQPAGKSVGKPVTRESWGTQVSPAVNLGAVDMFDSAPEENGLAEFKLRVVHLTTPVSVGKTHYYWALARDHGAPFDYERERAMADVVFGEDIAIVEQTQAMARSAIDQDDAVEFSVSADRAAVIGRRIISSMIQRESENLS
jgi:vanillate O-demethylase monooxygenase subunit